LRKRVGSAIELKVAARIPSRAETDLAEHNEILRILADTASDFINLPIEEVQPAIQHPLEDVAQRVGADRAYIFEYDYRRQLFKNTFEWCASGITAQIDNLQDIPFAGTEMAMALHQRGEPFIEKDVPGMPGCVMRDLLLPQAIKSSITIPLMDRLHCEGFIGFDFVRTNHRFTPRETNLLLLGIPSSAPTT
jgi:GAF domain-containing protein